MASNKTKEKLKKVIELLKFSLELKDEEMLKSTIDSVIDMLEEEIS
jgi:DUF1680 family protein